MKLPDGADARVPRSKLQEYLMSTSHPVGSAKARYFASRDYRVETPEELERALKEIARVGTVQSTHDTGWGTKYVVTGVVTAPDGDPVELATVWIVGDEDGPVLVTAYPWRGRTV